MGKQDYGSQIPKELSDALESATLWFAVKSGLLSVILSGPLALALLMKDRMEVLSAINSHFPRALEGVAFLAILALALALAGLGPGLQSRLEVRLVEKFFRASGLLETSGKAAVSNLRTIRKLRIWVESRFSLAEAMVRVLVSVLAVILLSELPVKIAVAATLLIFMFTSLSRRRAVEEHAKSQWDGQAKGNKTSTNAQERISNLFGWVRFRKSLRFWQLVALILPILFGVSVAIFGGWIVGVDNLLINSGVAIMAFHTLISLIFSLTNEEFHRLRVVQELKVS